MIEIALFMMHLWPQLHVLVRVLLLEEYVPLTATGDLCMGLCGGSCGDG